MNTPLPESLLVLDDQRLQAMLSADTQALGALLHPGLRYTHSDGRTDTCAVYLAALAGGALRYRRCVRESVEGSVWGGVAVLQGVLRLHALDQGQEKAIRIHYLANWVQDPGQGWCLYAWASTLINRCDPEGPTP